ncbi:MAG: retinol dehydrogenase 12 [Actinoplanes sp.]|jgi:NAD(P)-dependent dehydrogenase (short-subunit alcohol dehydrogenase family)|nr:retinol dehydrogenase 12 [Actinoplanes sp.]
MTDATCLITGGTGGIGAATAAALVAQGARVVLVGRDPAHSDAAADLIRRREPGANVDVLIADLALLAEVSALAAEVIGRYPQLRVVILNAAVARPRRELTAEGFEVDLATNHLAPFLLARLLCEHLATNAPARIVAVSSAAHRQVRTVDLDSLATSFSQTGTYATTKLLNLLAMTELARRLGGSGVTVNSADPGFVRTGLSRDATGAFGLFLRLARPFQRSPERAAIPIVSLATDPELVDTTGAYVTAKGPVAPSPTASDPDLANRVWSWTERLITP